MPIAIAMPKLGMTMKEGTVLEWRAGIGDRVEKGQVILIIESEKAEVEIEATATGVLRHIYEEPEVTVPCGTFLAALTESSDEPFEPASWRETHERREAAPKPAARVASAPAAPPGASARPGKQAVTPAARRAAKQLGVDPARIPGTGPGGRVTQQDVEVWAERAAALVAVADGVSLEVPSEGDGDPVLLLPGFGTDTSAFARQIPALAARYRARGVNPRGVGLSDAPELETYEIGTAASDVAAIAEDADADAGVEAGVHVVGASLGAAVALELALAHPKRVRSLVLIAPFVRAGGHLLGLLDAWCALAALGDPLATARAVVPWMFSSGLLAEDARRERAVRGFAEIAGRIDAATLERTAAGMRAWSGTREADLGAVGAPTLIVAAEEDLLTPGAAALAASIPGARCVSIPGAGHAVGLEAPDAVNRAILEHLRAAG